MRLKVEDILQMNHVDRWHTHRTHRTQNLSEHSAMVAIFSNLLYDHIVPEASKSFQDRYTLMWYSLMHDLPEIATSDIASPAKKVLRELFDGDEDPFEVLEDRLFPEIKEIKETVAGTPLKAINKLADNLDAIAFISKEGIGSTSKKIRERVSTEFRSKLVELAKHYPNYHWEKAELILAETLKAAKK